MPAPILKLSKLIKGGSLVLNWFEIIDYIFKGIVLAGGGYLFYFMRNSYEARIEILKETQVEKYVERMNKFKELYENMIQDKEKQISSLAQDMDKLLEQNLSKDDIIRKQKKLIILYKNKMIENEILSWERFLNNSINAFKIEYAKDKYIINNINNIIATRWTIKINDEILNMKLNPFKEDND